MFVTIRENETGKSISAEIADVKFKELPLKKDGWQFSWRQISRYENVQLFKLTLLDMPDKIEGMLAVSIKNEEMVYMENIEVAPHNYGRNGKFVNVAGCLISYACQFSIQYGKGNYKGFLSLESKTELINYYKEKYGAIQLLGQKMYFDRVGGMKLIEKYLYK